MSDPPSITVSSAVPRLLAIVDELRRTHHKRFTLDGRLVGDIGEVLVEIAYEVKLYDGVHRHHDAVDGIGRLVQIKATMQEALTFPAGHVPHYYLGIKINGDGSFREIFNGPGPIAHKAIERRSQPKTNLHSVRLGRLEALSRQVAPEDRIQRRPPAAAPAEAATP